MFDYNLGMRAEMLLAAGGDRAACGDGFSTGSKTGRIGSQRVSRSTWTRGVVEAQAVAVVAHVRHGRLDPMCVPGRG